VVRARRGDVLLVSYFVFSVGLISLAPWPEQYVRYLTPVLQVLAIFLVTALAALPALFGRAIGPRGRTIGRAAALIVLAGVVLAELFPVFQMYTKARDTALYYDAHGNETSNRIFAYRPEWRGIDQAAEWVRRRANPGDVVATTTPHTVYLRTGLKSVLPPLTTDPAKARRLLDGVPVRYVLLDNLGYPGISQRYTRLAVEGSDQWREVYISALGGGRVYERVRTGENSPRAGHR
ncbi:MAG: hypothetical protein ACREIT_11090, partial [Tepidisphaeraceae bacterium]